MKYICIAHNFDFVSAPYNTLKEAFNEARKYDYELEDLTFYEVKEIEVELKIVAKEIPVLNRKQ
ncbi:MAG TPA: hypothetical protein VFM18_05020 [Methanosarcina sp.]|nr:hypothetical protein [Methanosarcina sp.]